MTWPTPAQAARPDHPSAALCQAGDAKSGQIEVEVAIEDLKPNDVIVVSAGEQIPADGRILQGRGLVDERMIKVSRAFLANSLTTRFSLAQPFSSASYISRYCDTDQRPRSPDWPGSCSR